MNTLAWRTLVALIVLVQAMASSSAINGMVIYLPHGEHGHDHDHADYCAGQLHGVPLPAPHQPHEHGPETPTHIHINSNAARAENQRTTISQLKQAPALLAWDFSALRGTACPPVVALPREQARAPGGSTPLFIRTGRLLI